MRIGKVATKYSIARSPARLPARSIERNGIGVKKCPSCKESIPAKEFDNHVYSHIREGKLIGIETWIRNEGSRWTYLPADTLERRRVARVVFKWESSRLEPEGVIVRLLDAAKIKLREGRSGNRRAAMKTFLSPG